MHTTSTSGTTTITRLMALELSSSGTRTTTPSSSSTTSSSSSSSISSTSPPPLPPSSVVSVPPRVGSRSRGLSGGGARGVVSASGPGSGAFRQPMKSRRMERGPLKKTNFPSWRSYAASMLSGKPFQNTAMGMG
ncbi:hypothetical protein CRUP_034465 [Coryphaenoides rupestris]|nr:hypothetical protein CRUP_034465 [Coryphaenoides rupestris]